MQEPKKSKIAARAREKKKIFFFLFQFHDIPHVSI